MGRINGALDFLISKGGLSPTGVFSTNHGFNFRGNSGGAKFRESDREFNPQIGNK